MSSQTEQQDQPLAYSINDDTRRVITEICANKPYNTVHGIISALSNDILSAEEANAIVNAIGQFQYIEVHEFFTNISKYFVVAQPVEKEIIETKSTTKNAKKEATTKA